MDNYTIVPATIEDIPVLVDMINNAYRNPDMKNAWTTEANIIRGGVRVEPGSMERIIKRGDGTVLKYTGAGNTITGCVYLQHKSSHVYLGLLTVDADAQGQGIGKKLLQAADEYARRQQFTSIKLRVVSLRQELIDWYERHGYMPTGEKEPLQMDAKFGVPVQPLELIFMEKTL